MPTEPTGEEPTEEPVPTEPTGEEPTEEPVPTEPTGEEPTEEPVPTEPTGEEPTEEPVPTEPTGEEPTETPVNTEDATGNDDSDDDLTVIDITDLIHPDTNASETTDEEAGLESTTSSEPSDDAAEEVVESLEDTDEEVLGTEEGEEDTDIPAEGDVSEEIIVEGLEERSGAWNDAPTSLQATAAGNIVTLTWEHEAGAEAYGVYEVIDGTNTFLKTVYEMTATITNVTPGEHYYTVYSRQKNGGTAWQFGTPATPVLVVVGTAVWNDAPTNLQATAAGNIVTLTWEHEAGAEAYGVYEVIDGTNTFLKTVYEKTATITGVTPGEHSYTVYSRQKNGGTSWQFGTPAAPVLVVVGTAVWNDPPTNLQASASGNTVTLTWDHEAGAEAYGVYEVINGTNTFLKTVYAKTATISNVAPGAHTYTVYSRQKNGGTSWQFGTPAAPVQVEVGSAVWSDAPTELSAAVTGTTVTLTWNHEAGAEAYGVYEVVDGSNRYLKTVYEKSATITGVTPGDHYYTVYSRQKNGGTSWQFGAPATAVLAHVVGATWNDAPTGLQANVAGTTVTLTWNHEAGADAYGVYEIVEGTNVLLTTVNAKSATITGVTPGEHSYTVCALQADGDDWQYGAFAAAAVAEIESSSWKDAPTNLQASVTGDTVTLTWDHEAGAEAYGVYEVVDGSNRYLKTVYEKTATITGVSVGEHYYTVYSRQKNGGTSWQFGTPAAAVLAEVGAAAWDDAPTNLQATVAGDTVTLTWDHEAGAEAYGVYEVIDGSNRYLKTVYEKTATITGVSAGEHYYTVYSRQKNGGTSWQFGTPAAAVLVEVGAAAWNDAPTNLQATANGDTVTLTWDHEAGAEAYGVYEVINGTNTFLKTVYEKTATITGVATGEHYYTVYSRQKNGGTAWQFGTPAAAVLVEVGTARWNDAPTNLQAAVNGDTVTLTWDHEAGAEAYGVYEVINGTNTFLMTVYEKTATITGVAMGEHYYTVYSRQKNGGTSWQFGTPADAIQVNIGNLTVVINDVTYELVDESWVVTGYTGTASSLVIPETLPGYDDVYVTVIGESAFENNAILESIDLPDTITVIERCAFKNCSNLSSMQ